jgi:hypothetical protein
MLDPPIVRPAIELVTSTTPPSGFASKVGIALATRDFTPRTFVRQHLSHSSSERASRSSKAEKRVQPALAIRMSRPPRSLRVVETRALMESDKPASAFMVVVLMPGYFEVRSEARDAAAVELEA